jgi:hypothetical protein
MKKSDKTRPKTRRIPMVRPENLDPRSVEWNELETALRGLRNLNAMQLELIGQVERIGRRLRRARR